MLASVERRHRVTVVGEAEATVLVAHGLGCDQNIWLPVVERLQTQYRVITFDWVGSGNTDTLPTHRERYNTLDGHVNDLIELIPALQLGPCTYIGHSVGGLIGCLAAMRRPELFERVVALGSSPCYINHPPDYYGGFTRAEVDELMALMARNLVNWAGYLAPTAMNQPQQPELTERLRKSFISSNEQMLRQFAAATFYCDHRHDLCKVGVHVDLLYSENDVVVPVEVIEYMAQHLPDCSTYKLEIDGHYPHMSHPQLVLQAIQQCLTS